MSRPKGSKNKSTLLKEQEIKQEITQEIEQEIEVEETNKEINKEITLVSEPKISSFSSGQVTQSPVINESEEQNEEEIDLKYNFKQSTSSPNSSTKTSVKTSAKVSTTPIYTCTRCSAKSKEYLTTLDMTRFTSIATYHREMPNEVKLCRECAKELSNLVDSWYLEKGKGKFEVKEYNEETYVEDKIN